MSAVSTRAGAFRLAVASAGLAAALVVLLATPSVVRAERVWTEGTAQQPLTVGSVERAAAGTVRGKPGAALERLLLWEYRRPGSAPFDPFFVEALDNGNVLITSRTNEILEVDRRKRIVWSYTRVDDNQQLVNAYSAQRLPNGNTLIADRRADFVIEVTPDKRVVWRYGVTRDSLAPGSLVDPFAAMRLPNGNTLITDNRSATRILEVRTSDYDPTAPNLGYTANSIVWRYGRDDDGGVGPGQLASPRYAERLDNGNTLITDAADQVLAGHRIIEVTPSGQIVWQFGVAGVAGSDDTHINTPSRATRLANGNTLILEEDGARMIEVDAAGHIVDQYGGGEQVPEGGALVKGRSMDRTASGATLIAEQSSEHVIEVGYAPSGTLTSRELSLGLPGVEKTISRIDLTAETPAGTSATLAYSLDGGDWVTGGTSISLPEGSSAKQVRYRVTMKSGSPASTPVLRQVRIVYDVAPDPAIPTPIGGGTGGNGSGGTGGTGGSGGGGGSRGYTRSRTTASGSSKSTATTGLGGTGGSGGTGWGTGTPSGGGTAGPATVQTRYARGTLMDVLPLSGSDGIGLGSLGGGGSGQGDAVAFALAFLGVAYIAGAFGGPAASAAHSAGAYVGHRFGRSGG